MVPSSSLNRVIPFAIVAFLILQESSGIADVIYDATGRPTQITDVPFTSGVFNIGIVYGGLTNDGTSYADFSATGDSETAVGDILAGLLQAALEAGDEPFPDDRKPRFIYGPTTDNGTTWRYPTIRKLGGLFDPLEWVDAVSSFDKSAVNTTEVFGFASFMKADMNDTTPVPEPSTMALMVMGMATASANGWRKRRRRKQEGDIEV